MLSLHLIASYIRDMRESAPHALILSFDIKHYTLIKTTPDFPLPPSLPLKFHPHQFLRAFDDINYFYHTADIITLV